METYMDLINFFGKKNIRHTNRSDPILKDVFSALITLSFFILMFIFVCAPSRM